MLRTALVLIAASAISLAGAQAQAVDTPAPAGSFAPQLARASDGSILLSWLETTPAKAHRLRVARYNSGRWQPALTIAEGVEFFANWADVPSVSEHGGLLFAHWLEKSGAGTYAYHVKVRASRDNGKTWGAAYVPHSDRSATEHGFASFFTAPGGKPGLAWLDGRETGGGGHDASHKGSMTLRAALSGQAGTTDEALLDDRVCDCCPTAAISTPGAAIVAYRDRSADEVRDISVVRFANGAWSKPVTMKDNWQIGGCPVNGPALAARGKFVVLAWFTGADNKPAVKASHSKDEGKIWSAPVTLSTGIPLGRVAVALTDDGATHVAWLDHNDSNGRLLLRTVDSTGKAGAPVTLTAMKTDRNSGYPRMIADGNSLVYAWTETGPGGARKVKIGRLKVGN
ncbi:MAG: glycoside hydrolase [Acidobacteriota bacterium]|nr:glycoside hydrolase [Acidobacteriota bacterium]